jgi:hypothetical protein
MLVCTADFAIGLLARQAKHDLPGPTWMKPRAQGPVEGCDAQDSTTS